MRCSLGAVGVSVVQPIIDNIAAGPTFLIFAAFTVVLAPMLLLVWYYGEGVEGHEESTVEGSGRSEKGCGCGEARDGAMIGRDRRTTVLGPFFMIS